MIKPIALLFGYTRFSIDKRDATQVLNDANRRHIRLHIEQYESERFSFYAVGRSAKRVEALLQKRAILYTHVCGGLPKFIDDRRHRVGILLGVIFFLVLTQLSAQYVWDISIIGNRATPAAEILDMLAQNGLYVGAYGKNLDISEIAEIMQAASPEISWITIHHTGAYYTVEIVERERGSESEDVTPYYNVVASRDGQVQSLDIKSGRAVATPGSTVRKGDLLVSGIISTRMQGTKFATAAAAVLARVEDRFALEIPYETVQKEYGVPVKTLTEIKFFGKNILILKKPFKSNEKYDTIYTEKHIENDWLSPLPVLICQTAFVPYREEKTLQSEDALLMQARAAAEKFITERQYVEVLACEEIYSFSESGLSYVRNISAVENIAAVAKFDLCLTAERK